MSPRQSIPWRHHLIWGLGLGVAVSLAIQVLTWLGLGLSHLTWISTYVLVMVFAVLATRSLRDRGGARPTLWATLLLLLVMILVSRVIYQTYMWAYINYVDPDWVDTVAEVWSAQLAEAGTEADEIDQSIASFRRSWETGNVFTVGIVSFALPQLVLALLAAVLGVLRPWKRRAESS